MTQPHITQSINPEAFAAQQLDIARSAVIDTSSLESLLQSAFNTGASDIFVREGTQISLKIRGDFVSYQVFERKLKDFFAAECKRLQTAGGVDFSYVLPSLGKRVRINLFRCDGRLGFVARFPQNEALSFDLLGLPQALKRVHDFRDGFVLLVGPTGSGKTTTLSCLLAERIAQTDGHYLTLEDPIETDLHPRPGVIISQRELNRDFKTFPEALKHAMRQAPNTILVGEIRDPQTLALAVNLAETGHLVFSTYHAGNVLETVIRLSTFTAGDYESARLPLVYSLKLIVAQKLFKTIDGTRRMTCEYLFFDGPVRNLFLKEKFNELKSMMPSYDCLMFHDHIRQLKAEGVRITDEEEAELRLATVSH